MKTNFQPNYLYDLLKERQKIPAKSAMQQVNFISTGYIAKELHLSLLRLSGTGFNIAIVLELIMLILK